MTLRYSPFIFFTISVLIHAVVVAAVFSFFDRTQNRTVVFDVQYQLATAANDTSTTSHKNLSKPKTHTVRTAKLDDRATPSDSQTAGVTEATNIQGADLGINATYPRLSRVLGEKGQVLIDIKHGSLGLESSVSHSSGYERLDRSALSAIQDAVHRGLLTRVIGERQNMQISFVFKLDSEKNTEKN
jgi:TonB family protein